MFYKIGVLKKSTKFTGKNLSWSLFLNKVSGFHLATFISFYNLFGRTHLDDCYLCLPVNFWEVFFIEGLPEREVKVIGVQPAYTVKNYLLYHSHYSSIFINELEVAIRRCSFNSNLWQLPVKSLISSEVVRCSLQVYGKKIFCFISMYFAFIFSERITITSSEEALKVYQHNFFQEL